jgi:hypothetical protein
MPSRFSRGRQNNIDESNEEILAMRMCRVVRRGPVPVPTCTGMLVIEDRVLARRWKVAILITESLGMKLEQTRPKQSRTRLGEQTRPTFRNWSKLGLHFPFLVSWVVSSRFVSQYCSMFVCESGLGQVPVQGTTCFTMCFCIAVKMKSWFSNDPNCQHDGSTVQY